MAQFVLPLENRPALGREDFVTGPGNAEAVKFIDSYPDWPAPAAALYGPAGSGKSHLAAAWAAHAKAQIVEASALDQSVLHNPPAAIVIENVDEQPYDSARDAALFALLESGRHVLLTGRTEPSQWRGQSSRSHLPLSCVAFIPTMGAGRYSSSGDCAQALLG
ncbi:MAG: hypothetical protein WDM89_15340 [Rhizomicrobium sp.]